jgi:hypothetical protein
MLTSTTLRRRVRATIQLLLVLLAAHFALTYRPVGYDPPPLPSRTEIQ